MTLGLFLLAHCDGQLRYDRVKAHKQVVSVWGQRVGFRCFRPEEPLVCSLWARDERAAAAECCVPTRWGRRSRASARRRKRSDVSVRRAGTLASSSSSPLRHLQARISFCSSEPAGRTWGCNFSAHVVFNPEYSSSSNDLRISPCLRPRARWFDRGTGCRWQEGDRFPPSGWWSATGTAVSER